VPSLFFVMNGLVVGWCLAAPLLSVGALGVAWAQAQPTGSATVWRCGQLFTNQPQPGQVCEPISAVASTVVEGTRALSSSAGVSSSAARDRPVSSAGPSAAAPPSVANSASAQQARMLLKAELREQEERWQQLQHQWNQGQPIGSPQQPPGSAAYQEWVASLREQLHRAQADLAALRRELARLP